MEMGWLERLVIAATTLLVVFVIWLTIGHAADLSLKPKQVPAPAPVLGYSPFSIGFFGGIGLSPTENELTILGESQFGGGIKGFPTGILAGVEAEYLAPNIGPLVFGADVRAAYDFSRGCVDIACSASRKNGFLFQQGLKLGFSLTQLGGFIPTSGQPQNWPVPITVPTSVYANTILLADAGVAERNVDLCALNGGLYDANGNPITQCGSRFIAAFYIAPELKFMVSTNSEIKARWDHIFWGNQYSFTPQAAAPIFVSAVSIKSEDLFTLGYSYHF